MTRSRATRADVAARAAAAFAPSESVRIGAEVEWLVFAADDPSRPVGAAETASVAAGRLPAGGRVTIEPGGQVELVTEPFLDPHGLVSAIDADTAVLVGRFGAAGLVLVPVGLDPVRPPNRTLDLPRYAAMEHHFANRSPEGLKMMNLTASLQLNIDFGPDPTTTWQRAHRLAPVLNAAFANSPTTDGDVFAAVSHRQRVWSNTDPSRTRPVGADPAAWEGYILAADAMSRIGPTEIEPVENLGSFASWLDGADPPTVAELDLHLTTLFPPLRPRSYLELRMIDALPALGRAAAIGVVWSLLTDDEAGTAAESACSPLPDPWSTCLDAGIGDDAMHRAALALLATATESLRGTATAPTSAPTLATACAAWRHRITDPEPPATIEALLTPEPQTP